MKGTDCYSEYVYTGIRDQQFTLPWPILAFVYVYLLVLPGAADMQGIRGRLLASARILLRDTKAV